MNMISFALLCLLASASTTGDESPVVSLILALYLLNMIFHQMLQSSNLQRSLRPKSRRLRLSVIQEVVRKMFLPIPPLGSLGGENFHPKITYIKTCLIQNPIPALYMIMVWSCHPLVAWAKIWMTDQRNPP